jgi:PAS domain S-box-containing protein
MKENSAFNNPTIQLLIEKAIAGIYLVRNGRFFFVNDKVAEYTGYEIHELTDAKADSLIHPDDKKRVKEVARKMLRGETDAPYVFRIVTKNERIHWVMETISPFEIDGMPMLLGNTMDITDRMIAEEQLRISQKLYWTVFDSTPTPMIIMEEDTIVVSVNTAFEKLHGTSREHWNGKKSWQEYVHADDRERMLKYHHDRRIDPDSAPIKYEFRFITHQGEYRNVITLTSMIPGTKRSMASLVDISDRIEAEKKIQASENLYRTIFETTGTAMTIVEEDSSISLFNKQFFKLFGAGKKFWETEHSWHEYVHQGDLEKMIKYHHQRRIDTESVPNHYEFRLVDYKGDIRNVVNNIALIPGTKRSVSSYIDITDIKKAEEKILEREAQLKEKTNDLKELNSALKVLLKKRDEDREELTNNILSGLNKLVFPCIEKLKTSIINKDDQFCLSLLESHLRDLSSSFVSKLSSEHLNLTPRELQVASLIKAGNTTKEIADHMNISIATVEIHRHNIRKKLDLNRKKTNLRTYLSSLI